MRLISLTLLITAGSLSYCVAHACSAPTIDTAFDTVAPTASDIIAVQVESLALTTPDPHYVSAGDGHTFRGTIRIVKHYRGSGQFEEITYSNSRCGGLHLDVGGMYIIATNSSGPTIELNSGNAPILHLSGLFTFNPDLVLRLSETVKQLEAALRGEGTFAITSPAARREMSIFTPPPPVPPPEKTDSQ